MPELPEVEVVRLGLRPQILHQKITDVVVRHRRLRFPVHRQLKTLLLGQAIQAIARRGKYLLFTFPTGTVIWHLGMSGSIRLLTKACPPKKHDHIELQFENACVLRFNDPRRFGSVLWTSEDPLEHPLLATLGPEPLSSAFNANYLWEKSRKRKAAIKVFLMNSKIVVGVGNIYAAEALFAAGLHPLTPAFQVSRAQCTILSRVIKKILREAIRQGGTTLKDFVNSEGKPGYFKQQLLAYGRGGLPCLRCQTIMIELRLAQRATVFCPQCQP
jgi:formamidopyrimidine-DNA glycosylase